MQQNDLNYNKIDLLIDWEKETWKRVYYNLSKKGEFQYTHDKREAKDKIFTFSVGEIHKTTLKIPEKKSLKKSVSSEENFTNSTADVSLTNQGRQRANSEKRRTEEADSPRGR